MKSRTYTKEHSKNDTIPILFLQYLIHFSPVKSQIRQDEENFFEKNEQISIFLYPLFR